MTTRLTSLFGAALVATAATLTAPRLSLGQEKQDPRPAPARPLQISGVYPHLAAFNKHGECGIGAVVPWAGRLWWITYPPHFRQGSNDKLYSIDESLQLTIHPESVGGTHAARMIHRPSGQLLIGPYAIDKQGRVRAMDVKNVPGRYTAWAAHLTDPAKKAYLFDMEGPIWEVDVTTLAAQRLFVKPAPGWHGKGAYTGQGRLAIANNGEASAAHDLPKEWELPKEQWSRGPEDAGALAEYDGKEWRVVLRRQFVEVAGPGGIEGNSSPEQPLWAVGWDQRSVLLLVCDEGRWTAYRLPKASHAMDPRHGWYTEWPRIRPISDDRALLCMHGMFFDFPLTFSARRPQGIRPLASHLRYVPDFCMWNDRLVVAADDTSIMQNPKAGQSQSNLWFGSLEELKSWGPGYAFGGPWLGDAVMADVPSDPYLFAGFQGRMLHLASRPGEPVEVTLETHDGAGGEWRVLQTIAIPAEGYVHHVFADDAPGEWIRFRASRPATVSAYLHYARAAGREHPQDAKLFAGLRSHDDAGPEVVVRPAGHNRNLQVIVRGAEGQPSTYYEFDEQLQGHRLDDAAQLEEASKLLEMQPLVTYDGASAIIVDPEKRRYRLPVAPGVKPLGRDVREVQSERSLVHAGNIFYEAPRGEAGKEQIDFRRMRPIAAHRKAIHDFCTWRGLLVLTGARPDQAGDGHVFAAPEAATAIWAGAVDDLWKLGKPVGVGGPWKNSLVEKDAPSDPYLMTGFDRKTLRLSHDADQPVTFRIEVDYSNRDFWKLFGAVTVPAGETATVNFPDGYSAHWVRLTPDADCRATAIFHYE